MRHYETLSSTYKAADFQQKILRKKLTKINSVCVCVRDDTIHVRIYSIEKQWSPVISADFLTGASFSTLHPQLR